MRHYRVTLVAETSLHLGRDRATRVSRYSHHYIPASTISGAVNTFLHQRGLYQFMGKFRFTNLYITEGDAGVWVPTPHNVLVCPACKKPYVVKKAGSVWGFEDLVCSCANKALRKPYKGFILVQNPNPASFVIPQDIKLRKRAVKEAWLVGRTAHGRWRGIQQEGKLHFVEILPSNSKLAFQGYLSIMDGADELRKFLDGARLRVGGLLSRGCGRVKLNLRLVEEITERVMANGKLLVVETPLLLLPSTINGSKLPKIKAATTSQVAEVGVCERWSIKLEAESRGGLITFTNVLDIGTVIEAQLRINEITEAMFFYEIESGELNLYKCPLKSCLGGKSAMGPYSLEELWSLGFGHLRLLDVRDSTSNTQ